MKGRERLRENELYVCKRDSEEEIRSLRYQYYVICNNIQVSQ